MAFKTAHTAFILRDLRNFVERRKITIIIEGFHLTQFFLVQLYWLVESSLIMFVRSWLI